MRTLVNIDETQIESLDALAKTARRPRAALIREAIGEYLAKRRVEETEDAFGLWGEGPDGLTYQRTMREEW